MDSIQHIASSALDPAQSLTNGGETTRSWPIPSTQSSFTYARDLLCASITGRRNCIDSSQLKVTHKWHRCIQDKSLLHSIQLSLCHFKKDFNNTKLIQVASIILVQEIQKHLLFYLHQHYLGKVFHLIHVIHIINHKIYLAVKHYLKDTSSN